MHPFPLYGFFDEEQFYNIIWSAPAGQTLEFLKGSLSGYYTIHKGTLDYYCTLLAIGTC